MNTTRTVLILTALGLSLGVTAGCSGCSKAKKKDPGGGSGSSAAAVAPASSELRLALGMMPLESEGIIGIDLAKLRGSELYRHYEKDLRGMAAGQLASIEKLCNFDPTEKVTSVVASGKGSRKKGNGTLVVRGLSKAETMACMTKVASEPPPEVKVTIDGDLVMIEAVVEKDEGADDADGDAGVAIVPAVKPDKVKDPKPAPAVDAGAGGIKSAAGTRGESVSIQFLDDTTALVARRKGKAANKKQMQAIIDGKEGDVVVQSAPFMAMIDGIDTNAPVWFVVNGKSSTIQGLTRNMFKFEAAYGHVYIDTGLEVDATIRVDGDDTAKGMSDMIQRQVQSMKKSLMKEMLGEVTVEQNGANVHLNIKESREQLEKLVDFVLSIFGD